MIGNKTIDEHNNACEFCDEWIPANTLGGHLNCSHCGKRQSVERVVEAPPQMGRIHGQQIDAATTLLPLVTHVASGGWLEFKRNDQEWRIVEGNSFREVAMSPDRYRVAK